MKGYPGPGDLDGLRQFSIIDRDLKTFSLNVGVARGMILRCLDPKDVHLLTSGLGLQRNHSSEGLETHLT